MKVLASWSCGSLCSRSRQSPRCGERRAADGAERPTPGRYAHRNGTGIRRRQSFGSGRKFSGGGARDLHLLFEHLHLLLLLLQLFALCLQLLGLSQQKIAELFELAFDGGFRWFGGSVGLCGRLRSVF